MPQMRYPSYLLSNPNQDFETLIAEHPEDKEKLLCIQAIQYFSSPPHHQQCIDICERLIKESTDKDLLGWAYYLSAILYAENKDTKNKALEYHLKALEIEPDSEQSLTHVYDLLLENKNYDEALKHAKKLTEIDDEQSRSDGYERMGRIHSLQKNYPLAIEHYQSALQQNPENDTALLNLGIAYAEDKQYELAKKTFQQYIEQYPNVAEGYYNLGHVYDFENDYYRALHNYTEALKIRPDYASALNNIGALIYKHEGDYKATIKHLEKAVALSKDPMGSEMALIYQNLHKLNKQMLNESQSELYLSKWYECMGLKDLFDFREGGADFEDEDED